MQHAPSSPPSAGEADGSPTWPPSALQQPNGWLSHGPVSSSATARDEITGSAIKLEPINFSNPAPVYQRHGEPWLPNSTTLSPVLDRPGASDMRPKLVHDREEYLSRHVDSNSSLMSIPPIIEPSSPPTTTISASPQRRKLTIQELVNTSGSEGSRSEGEESLETKALSFQSPQDDGQSLSKSSGMQRPYDFRLPYTLQNVTRIRRQLVQRKHGNHAMLKVKNLKRRQLIMNSESSLGSNTSSSAPSQSPKGRHTWRIDKWSSSSPAPSIAPTPALSTDDILIEQTLLQTASFFTSQISTSWPQVLLDQNRHHTNFFLLEDTKTHSIETFSSAITTAAGLLAVDRIESASSLLNHTLPYLHHFLTSQHPQLYPILAELSLDCQEDSSLGRLRGQIKQFAASLSHTVLGPLHPITRLLRLELSSPDQTARLRELIQRKIHDLHADSLSLTDPLTAAQGYYLARVLAQLGHLDDAVRVLDDVTRTWEKIYGQGSLMSILGMIESAKLRIRRESVDFKEVEDILLDALAKTTNLHDGQNGKASRPPASAEFNPRVASGSTQQSPDQNLPASIVHTRMACLRTLGRLYAMRDRPHRALQYYAQGVQIGIDELGPSVPAVQLALADLDVVGKLALLNDSST